MTDHPKPIARYRLCNDVHVDRYERGSAQQYWDVLKNQTDVVLVRDHEAALAAEREKYEARIAELEQKYIEALDFANEEMIKRGDEIKERARDNEQWRTAIEAKARELRERDGDNEDEDRAYRKIASELLALLEKKP